MLWSSAWSRKQTEVGAEEIDGLTLVTYGMVIARADLWDGHSSFLASR